MTDIFAEAIRAAMDAEPCGHYPIAEGEPVRLYTHRSVERIGLAVLKSAYPRDPSADVIEAQMIALHGENCDHQIPWEAVHSTQRGLYRRAVIVMRQADPLYVALYAT